ncbi:hypothetical protein K0M31_020515 [Melipona bicolor]|uniref:Transmembrane protein n=1 Tax=Melipona bicolor TaxID=60889 RepID=A0AA40G538_9HYME|nr:hypothetical protein K0M31_020515 [Melipona bicolor]
MSKINDNEDDSDIFKIRKLYLKVRLLLFFFSELHILYNSVIVLKHYCILSVSRICLNYKNCICHNLIITSIVKLFVLKKYVAFWCKQVIFSRRHFQGDDTNNVSYFNVSLKVQVIKFLLLDIIIITLKLRTYMHVDKMK